MDRIIPKKHNTAGCSPANFQLSTEYPGGLSWEPFSFSRLLMTYQQLYHHKLVYLLMNILYRPIRHFSDCETLQNDLDKLAQWDQQWGMLFHPFKCNSMSVIRSKTPFKYNYMLKGYSLESVDTATYFGITISSTMTWNAHINNITSKAQKLLGFLRRKLQINNEYTKSMAYKSLVR